MSKLQILKQESFDEITSALRRAGFKILLFFSLLILAVITIAQPPNVYVASFFGLSWCAISIAGITFPKYQDVLTKLWAVLTIPVAPYLVLSNGIMPATLVPIATIFPILLLSNGWRVSAMVVLACCTFLVPLYEGGYDKGLWLRLCVTNLVVSVLIYALASQLEKALIESKNKTLKLNKALESEKQASAAQSRFLATMSHEIRTPLNGILGLTDVVLSHDISESARPNLKNIQRSGQLLNRILNDILDLSKLNAGKLALEIIPFDLKSTAKDCVAFYVQLARNKGLSLRIEVDKTLNTCVAGDATRLSQVLNNLVSNAIKFTHQGSVTLGLSKGEASKTHQFVRFSVKDTGEGIDASEQERVFDAFIQANSSINRMHGGTGLGLQIVKSLVEAMGGTVYLKSEVGQGSEFYFELPFEIVDSVIGVEEQGSTPSFSNLTVLVAEDNDINQVVAKSLLEDTGLKVVLANNGKEAVKLAQKQHFDLILMDLHMPEMDGSEAALALREVNTTIPIIAFTAAVVAEEIDKALAAGMNGYLTKPINKAELHAELNKYLSGGKSTEIPLIAEG
ncbi:response regulator [Alteromonas sp. ALT199]|uniref:ATP-binding protein n=1 Tax=unclassified Alteromonas TaxID=2614992 RepID=UPI0004A3CBBF|nr:ATP-binding protein [Alteromonas sp. ALT199]MBT3133738.1 response regulator [Alteromonas sp. ALT199]